jgi:hypothetical protein
MDLHHERLDVYHLALDFLALASEIIEGLPRAARTKPPNGKTFPTLRARARLLNPVKFRKEIHRL